VAPRREEREQEGETAEREEGGDHAPTRGAAGETGREVAARSLWFLPICFFPIRFWSGPHRIRGGGEGFLVHGEKRERIGKLLEMVSSSI
jgi:hypothetical protein